MHSSIMQLDVEIAGYPIHLTGAADVVVVSGIVICHLANRSAQGKQLP